MTDGAASDSASTGNANVVPSSAGQRSQPGLAFGTPAISASAPRGITPWLQLAHPRELTLGIAPAAVVLALLWATGGRLRPIHAIFTFAALLLVQAGAHVLDEYVEFERRKALAGSLLWSAAGIDDHPLSVADTSPLLALRVGIALLVVGACCGIPLISTGGPVVAALGVLGLAVAVLYSSTNYALKRLPGGEIAVMLAFGPGVAIATALAQQQRVTGSVVLIGVALGLLAFAYLLAGTLRTHDVDAQMGRKSFAVVFGTFAAKLIYVVAVVAAYILTLLAALPHGADHGAAAIILALPATAMAVTGVVRAQSTAARATTIGQTLRMYVLFALWLLIGLLAAGAIAQVVSNL